MTPRVAIPLAGTGLLAGVLSLGLAPRVEPPFPEPGAPVDFATQIRPILSDTCFKCHGPDDAAREAGLRLDTPEGLRAVLANGLRPVTPGDREASELWRRITTDDRLDQMPPPASGKSLTAEQIELLGRWIDAGAAWQDHWSFEPVLRHPLPDVQDARWPRSAIDRFVLARLESEGLAPSPPADKATLLRRVTLDLTGLPPTLEEADAFLADESPEAYERLVDRLLDSPRFGERWARVWLDLARYADTRGYEKDAGRTIWPYRDWVIRALNADMPFDEFTITQLAGDLLEDATDDDILATAFHRNTMNNDEGGTDDEEFRVAAVKDRVNTTFSVWTGLTMACAECHTHKYDPITQTEYYEAYAFFNQTADADTPDEAPTRAFGTAEQRRRLAELREELGTLDERIARHLDAAADSAQPKAAAPPPLAAEPRDLYWIDDDAPAGAQRIGERGPAHWRWVSADEHQAAAGTRSLVRSAPEFTQIYAQAAPIPLPVHAGDNVVTHVWLDGVHPPREIMIQIHTVRAGWAHRAYWGENLIGFGADNTGERLPLGPLPERSRWVRLEFPAADINLRPGDEIDGWAFSQFGGTVRWDGAGLVTTHTPDTSWRTSQAAWERLMRGREGEELPEPVRTALLADAPTDEQRSLLPRHYLEHFHAPTREVVRPLREAAEAARAEIVQIESAMARVPIMDELAPDMQRSTHLLEVGSFLSPGEEVSPGVPDALHEFPSELPPNRLGFAAWLVSPDNPLTARVTVNRFWERFFGRGLVETMEDFGAQGAPPTHPALLDHLALRFMENGWSIKGLCREIVTSATYRQSSAATPKLLERDPYNKLYTRGPRFRVEAEMLRDQALAVSGLLSPKMYGPPVYPPQPDGIWQVVYSGESWMTSTGEDRYRRGLYTYWRRTSPYPSMITFDAPSREVCTPRRFRTNTPLQALVTLNDPVYVEAAQALARRMIDEGGPIASDRAALGLRLALIRDPRPAEVDAILALVADEYARYRDNPDDAIAMATDPLGPLPDGLDPAEAAAWTVAANVILNLDEFLTRR